MCIFGMLSSPLFLCDDYRVLLVIFWDSLFTTTYDLIASPFIELGLWLSAVSIQVQSIVCTVAFCILLTLLLMLLDIVFYQKKDWILVSSAKVCNRGQALDLYLWIVSSIHCHMLRPSTKLLSVSRLILVFYP